MQSYLERHNQPHTISSSGVMNETSNTSLHTGKRQS